MPTEICPRCRQPRQMTLTQSTRSAIGADGSTKRVRTDSYHCATCHAFVRSEEADQPVGPDGNS